MNQIFSLPLIFCASTLRHLRENQKTLFKYSNLKCANWPSKKKGGEGSQSESNMVSMPLYVRYIPVQTRLIAKLSRISLQCQQVNKTLFEIVRIFFCIRFFQNDFFSQRCFRCPTESPTPNQSRLQSGYGAPSTAGRAIPCVTIRATPDIQAFIQTESPSPCAIDQIDSLRSASLSFRRK